ncbi:MAG: efflux RND transporter periplasmic adaptor subunit [Roseiarcus sp.]|jgi:multidrug efflux system membrane fusion protein
MGFRGYAGAAALVVAAALAYCAYAPDNIEKWVPAAGGFAHDVHDGLAGGAKARTSAQTPAVANPRAASVSVAAAKRTDYPIYIDGLGQAQAYNTVTVRTRVDGQIEKIAFDEGQMVKAGDLIAQIDPRPFQAALDQAKAKQAQDQANLANAKLDLQRYATLAKQSFATQQQLDTQNALVAQLIASIAADAAAIDAAQVQLDYATISAPLAGRAGLRMVDQGNIVSAAQQTGIVTIAQMQPIAVIFTAPQDDLPRIRDAMAAGAPPVLVCTSDGARLLATGKLTVIDNQVDPTTGTIRLKAEFANEDGALWPGLAVSTRLMVGLEKNALVVPIEAIQRGPNGLYAYVVGDDNRVSARPVTVSHQDENVAVVAKGLNDGDRVVTVGQYGLQPGVVVSIDASAKAGS